MKHAKVVARTLFVVVWALGCGDSIAPQGNKEPRIVSLTAQPGSVVLIGSVQVTVIATDSDADILTFNWSSTGGSFTDSTASFTTWNAPGTAGNYILSVVVSDGSPCRQWIHISRGREVPP